MRLVFQEGKQRELIQKEREKLNLSLYNMSKKLGIKYGKLLAYCYDGVLLPENLFNEFLSKKEFKKYILEKRKDNWGKSKGGKLSKGNTKEIEIPQDSSNLAEFYGIMLGDGNLMNKRSYKIGTYQIRIAGDSRHDKEYLHNYVKPLIEKLFNIKVKLYKDKKRNFITLVATSKKLVEFLELKGFKAGNKIINQLEIPSWIREEASYLRVCLRGLYDTDGSVYKLTNQNSHQICFTNYNKKLMNNVRESLLSFGINPSKVTKGRDLLITKKSELKKFLNEIGFKNSRHLDKVEKWSLQSPVV